jgi:LacI family transcriptional regulator
MVGKNRRVQAPNLVKKHIIVYRLLRNSVRVLRRTGLAFHKPLEIPMPALPRELSISVFLQLDTEHGRGILRGVARFFRSHHDVVVSKFHKDLASGFPVLRRNLPDGIIAKISSAKEERALAALGVPVINISGRHPTARLRTVNSDDLQIGRTAFRYLYGKGHRHFAYCGSRTHAASRLRWAGFQDEASRQSVTLADGNFLAVTDHDQPRLRQMREALARWIRDLPRPAAVFAFTDQLALEIAEACARTSKRIPDDVAILGVGNDQTRLAFSPVEISSIQLNTLRIGELAAEMLLAAMRDGIAPRNMLVLPVKIVPRHSTDRFAVDDEIVSGALDYIQENAGNVIHVDDVARTSGVSRRVLELKFRHVLGTSVYAEVRRMHFAHAIQLMADPGISLGEIAYASGFPSAQQFSTAFRQHYKESASSHREKLLGRVPA